jgi:hypothetical protein
MTYCRHCTPSIPHPKDEFEVVEQLPQTLTDYNLDRYIEASSEMESESPPLKISDVVE